jgi:arginyl-tRNA synthetase
MKEKISNLINDVIKKLDYPQVDFVVDYPADLKFGEYSCNMALILSKQINKNPQEIAEIFKQEILKSDNEIFEKIEVAGPGFLNFYLNNKYYYKNISIAKNLDLSYGRGQKLKNKKIIIDHTDPNVLKQFHIGHLMSNAIGEFISRVYEWNGAKVIRYTYQGDLGMHIAKTIWGMKKMRDAFPQNTDSLTDKLKFIGQAYTLGDSQFEEDENSNAEIKEINKKVYELYDDNKENDDLDLEVYYKKGKEWSLLHFEEIYHKLGVSFDRYIFESEVFKRGQKIIHENVPNVFELSDGAIIYNGEKEGLHTRVFINSQGLPTYEAKEIGLVFFKKQLTGEHDVSIVITANEQIDYFKVLKSALSKIDQDSAKKLIHISHGMMRFAEGKMSSRKGNVITGESLINDVENLVLEKISDRNFDLKLQKEIAETVAVGAIKYSILKQGAGKDIKFDFEKSLSFEGDSGPYIQYSYIRAKSVLEKAVEQKIFFDEVINPSDWQITKLEKLIARFGEVVEKSMIELSPQHLATYLISLAGEFNSWYAGEKIIDHSSNMNYKLNLTAVTMMTLRNGLQILGIRVPEKM